MPVSLNLFPQKSKNNSNFSIRPILTRCARVGYGSKLAIFIKDKGMNNVAYYCQMG